MNPLTNSVTTSAFDLPENLAAKAEPGLVAADERHFAAIAASLEEAIAELFDRLDAEVRAPGGGGRGAVRPPRRRAAGAGGCGEGGDAPRRAGARAPRPPAHPAPLRP